MRLSVHYVIKEVNRLKLYDSKRSEDGSKLVTRAVPYSYSHCTSSAASNEQLLFIVQLCVPLLFED